MMCISETYLDLSFPDDHPDLIDQVIIWLEQIILTILREVMFVFTLRSLSLFVRKHKKNAFEVFIHNRKDSVVSLYRSPGQTQEQFNDFLLNSEQLLSDITSCNPSFLLIAGGFNKITSSWWRKDSTTSEGTQIEVLTCSYGLNQLILVLLVHSKTHPHALT